MIRGATLTLTHRNGGLLTAFLALFVTFVGRSFWRLFCRSAHFIYSTAESQDCFYHQRQAILRNTNTAMTGLAYLTQVAWVSRNKSSTVSLRIVPLLIFAIVISTTFSVAGIFSSWVRSRKPFHRALPSSDTLLQLIRLNASMCLKLRSHNSIKQLLRLLLQRLRRAAALTSDIPQEILLLY